GARAAVRRTLRSAAGGRARTGRVDGRGPRRRGAGAARVPSGAPRGCRARYRNDRRADGRWRVVREGDSARRRGRSDRGRRRIQRGLHRRAAERRVDRRSPRRGRALRRGGHGGIERHSGVPAQSLKRHLLKDIRGWWLVTVNQADYFAGFCIQFTDTTIGALALSMAVLSKNRPSRDTAYCGLLPRTLMPVARYVWNSGTGSFTSGAAPPNAIDTAIILPSGAM